MKFSILNHISSIALGALLCLASCSDEIATPVNEEPVNQAGLNFRCAEMLEVNYGAARAVSRAGANKSPREKQIKSLHIFFFHPETGDLLEPTSLGFPSYRWTDEGEFITVPKATPEVPLFVGNPDKVLVVALANIDATDDAENYKSEANRFRTKYTTGGKIQEASRAALGDNETTFIINNIKDLEKWVYYPRMRMDEQTEEGDIQGLPEAGMPMICTGQVIDLNSESAQDRVINMVAMMAKVNVTVELDPRQSTSEYPILEITGYGVRNMPVAVPFNAHTGAFINESTTDADVKTALKDKPGDFETCKTLYDVTTEPMYHIGGIGDGGNECKPEDHEFVTTLATPRIINKNSAPVSFTYYTYENINVPDYGAERANGDDAFEVVEGKLQPKYPEGIDGFPAEYQRWKSTLAYSFRASALVLKGRYTNHQGMLYNAQFTVYLGADADKDFMVKRNHQYDNAITIKGLEYIRNSTDDVYTFDGRVNVVDDNPFYLAVVNERNVDAHASALPMDVWLMYREPENKAEYYSEVTVEIPEKDSKGGNARDWVQMVMIPRAEMEKGNFKAGTGCEPYFYTNLLTDIKNYPNDVLNGNDHGYGDGFGYPGHYAGAQCGDKVVITSTPYNVDNPINNSRARVYFYIDENTSITDNEASLMLNTPDLKDRMVSVNITYRRYTLDADGEQVDLEPPRKRTLDIEQRGLRRVPATWTGNNGETDNIPETYIEYTEEYLDHNDPLEHHVTGEVYPGLEWGLYNVGVNYSTSYTTGFVNNYDAAGGHDNYQPWPPEAANGHAYNIYKKNSALAFTQWVINNSRTDAITEIKLYNDTVPQSAFHYCYGKNKRAYDGSVTAVTVPTTGSREGTKSWYMPGIRELETALVHYWNTFSDFQDQLYWSSACGVCPYNGIGGAAQPNQIDNRYARATKVDASGRYINSGIGEEGYLPRTNDLQVNGKSAVNRIRAFYRRN